MSHQELLSQYAALNGTAEKMAFLQRCDGKNVHWRVRIIGAQSRDNECVIGFTSAEKMPLSAVDALADSVANTAIFRYWYLKSLSALPRNEIITIDGYLSGQRLPNNQSKILRKVGALNGRKRAKCFIEQTAHPYSLAARLLV